ncbi:hypothetical protein S7711_06359 [Stachybotrys chartarum IBT 7711]|uniref:Thioredoxin domain-containing protein n=1 Tax=Stachybotrys chartarum (strain CBS 109288 / IBT 7711) TaxID=1280523 RepID=A0A084AG86_STACB|nr:hypothetical protein S7711_06359 [Stachybotrys chartarum IBT 7711]KFA52790.1 hypothetical protein S40293_00993 [Stachybotrys chartarum IBT 40293]KFA75302.1 hypothetical protein S40288_00185 [Stachybotrys chartarum IBT 40288]
MEPALQPQPQQKSSFWQEVDTLRAPPPKDVAPAPKLGSEAPTSPKLPLADGRPTLVVFLRHCGCPFAEKTFKALSTISSELSDQIQCVAVSHSSPAATERWIPHVGGTWGVDVVVDEERDLYAQWGLGLATTWQTVGPSTIYSVFRLGLDEGIWNRPAESGTRWQKGGAFAVDGSGIVKWAHISPTADSVPDLGAAVKALGFEPPVLNHHPSKSSRKVADQGIDIKY